MSLLKSFGSGIPQCDDLGVGNDVKGGHSGVIHVVSSTSNVIQ